MTDYTYPSVYLAYLFFALMTLLTLFFFVKSWKDGYWSRKGEDIKHRIFEDDERSGS
jgi:hypothetical protein